MIDEKKLIEAFDENSMFLPEVVEKLICNQPKIDEWITGRNPTKEECGKSGRKDFQVTIICDGKPQTLVMSFCCGSASGNSRWEYKDRESQRKVIAWKPLSDPYIPTEE